MYASKVECRQEGQGYRDEEEESESTKEEEHSREVKRTRHPGLCSLQFRGEMRLAFTAEFDAA